MGYVASYGDDYSLRRVHLLFKNVCLIFAVAHEKKIAVMSFWISFFDCYQTFVKILVPTLLDGKH